MPKMKTHKGLKKRVKVGAKGKVKGRRAGSGHLMSHKSGKRCRGLRTTKLFSGAIAQRFRDALGES